MKKKDKDKSKNTIIGAIRDYVEGVDLEDPAVANSDDISSASDLENTSPFTISSQTGSSYKAAMHNVVSLHQNAPYIVLKKITKFEDVHEIAVALRDNKILVLNTEDCEKSIAMRVIDFLAGVAYGNDGCTEKIASGAYLITPGVTHLEGDFAKDEAKDKSDKSVNKEYCE